MLTKKGSCLGLPISETTPFLTGGVVVCAPGRARGADANETFRPQAALKVEIAKPNGARWRARMAGQSRILPECFTHHSEGCFSTRSGNGCNPRFG